MEYHYKESLVQSSILQTVYKITKFGLNLFRLWAPILLYLLSSNKKSILSDVGSFKQLCLSLVFSKHYRNLFYYRIGRCSILLSWVMPYDKSIIIHYKMELGEHAHFVHNTESNINAESIGKNFICYQHVTIGTKNLFSNEKPVIGDDVILYTGAVVVGNINVGNHVHIGANSVVYKDVPDNCTICGNPARIVKKDGHSVNELL